MNTSELGKSIVEYCRKGQFLEAVEEFYAEDVVSVEGMSTPGMDRITRGKAAVLKKGEWWTENHEIHEFHVEGPFLAEGSDQFVVYFEVDVTNKPSGQRFKGSEVGLYTVDGGKIKHEVFFAPPMPQH